MNRRKFFVTTATVCGAACLPFKLQGKEIPHVLKTQNMRVWLKGLNTNQNFKTDVLEKMHIRLKQVYPHAHMFWNVFPTEIKDGITFHKQTIFKYKDEDGGLSPINVVSITFAQTISWPTIYTNDNRYDVVQRAIDNSVKILIDNEIIGHFKEIEEYHTSKGFKPTIPEMDLFIIGVTDGIKTKFKPNFKHKLDVLELEVSISPLWVPRDGSETNLIYQLDDSSLACWHNHYPNGDISADGITNDNITQLSLGQVKSEVYKWNAIPFRTETLLK